MEVRGLIDLGCFRIRQVLEELGNPQCSLASIKSTKFIHVTGTNGKGSTCAMITSALKTSGKSVGRFTSPHLITPEDSIVYCDSLSEDFRLISSRHYLKLRSVITRRASAINSITEFELQTCIALLFFSYIRPDYVVIEVGMGGRRDATNVIDGSKDCILTGISLDHTEYLGNLEADICREKIGIVRDRSRVFSSSILPSDCVEIVRTCTSEQKDCWIIWIDVSVSPWCNRYCLDSTDCFVPIALAGRHQLSNAKLAAAVCARQYPVIPFDCGLIMWPGRLQKDIFCGRNVLIDGAHNIDGLRNLFEHVRDIRVGPIFWIIAFSGQKSAFLDAFPLCDSDVVCLTQIKPIARMPWISNSTISSLKVTLSLKRPWQYVIDRPSLSQSLLAASLLLDTSLVIVTGSLYLVGEYLSIKALNFRQDK